MDCILYIDLFFLWNFWMNALVLFLMRQLTKTYRTLWCLLAAAIGSVTACFGIAWYIVLRNELVLFAIELFGLVLMNVLAFGGKNLLWHLFVHVISVVSMAGVFLYMVSKGGIKNDTVAAGMVSVTAAVFCVLLEKKSRIRWKEEHMKAKTVLEFADRKLFATALMDTGNKLYDPFFHKPVILVDERMLKEILDYCRKERPEKLHFIPFHSVGMENGLLEGVAFDCVSIKWQNKQMKFREVIAAATKESLYQGKEYQVIFHCGLLEGLYVD